MFSLPLPKEPCKIYCLHLQTLKAGHRNFHMGLRVKSFSSSSGAYATKKISTSSTFDACGNLESTVQHSSRWLLFTGTIANDRHKGWPIITMHFDTNVRSAVRQRKIFAIFGQQTANARQTAVDIICTHMY